MLQRFFVLIFMYIGLFQVQAQTNNIWFITGNYLQSIEDLPKDVNIYPISQKNKTVLPYYIFEGNDPIKDTHYNISSKNILVSYRFGILSPHSTLHLMFVKNGKWEIINMNESLLTVIAQGVVLCKQHDLDSNDSYKVFQEILSEYKLNDSRKNGTPIIITE